MSTIYTANWVVFTSPPEVLPDGSKTAERIAAGEWPQLAAFGVYRVWCEQGDDYGFGYTQYQPGPHPGDGIDAALQYIAGTVAERTEALRATVRDEVIAERTRRVDVLVTGAVGNIRGHIRTTAGAAGLLALVVLGEATAEEVAALSAALGRLDGVGAIEDAEALILADVDAAADIAALEAIRAEIKTDSRWPT